MVELFFTKFNRYNGKKSTRNGRLAQDTMHPRRRALYHRHPTKRKGQIQEGMNLNKAHGTEKKKGEIPN
jgi:hypothetical protein